MELKKYTIDSLSTRLYYGNMPKEEKITESGYPIFSGYRYIGYYKDYNIKQRLIVVIARGVGGTGDVRIAEKKTFLTNLSIAVEINSELADVDFLYYYLNAQGLRYLDSGAAQSQITIESLKRHKVFLPVLNKQMRIASILLNYDILIDTNNKRINALEQMAENLYKEWFVRFRFPGHETADFENGIPKGWAIKKLSEISSFAYGKMPDSAKYVEDGYPIFSGYRITGYYDCYMYDEPMLVLIARGVGGTGEVKVSPPFAYITNLAIVFLLFKPKLHLNYLYRLFSIQNLRYLDTGAAQSQITIENLKNVRVIIPPEEHLIEYNTKAEMIKRQIDAITKTNDNLIKQRDLLLPRLMSGKLEV